MTTTAPDAPYEGIFSEVSHVLRSGRYVWSITPFKQRGTFGIVLVLMILVSGCNIAFPLLMGNLVDGVKSPDEVNRNELLRSSAVILGWIAALYVSREFIQIVRRALVESACTRFEQKLTVRVIGQTMRTDLTRQAMDKIGSVQGRIGRSVVATVRYVRLILLECLPPFVTGGFALVAALAKQPILALAMAGVIPLSLWLTVRQIASQKGIRLRLIRGREKIDGTITELLGGLEYVRAAHTEDRELERFDATTRDLRRLERKHHFEMSLYGAARALNEGFFHILVLGLGIYFAVEGRITYGEILTFSILFLTVMAPLNEVHRALDEGHECGLQIDILRGMLDEPPDRSYAAPRGDAPKLETGEPLIVADELVVEYATPDGPKRVLDRVTLCVRHGETVGLAGPSGCGKTTFLRVLLRLTHPTEGRFRVGHTDLEHVSRADIGRLIGYVGQNPFVFHGTIGENISYGFPDPTRDRIEEAARLAGIHDEIVAMPGGYNARVQERGSNLSGGQRQRLALARIFLKDPPILILDEGTSALDTTGERHVRYAIERARQDRTVVMVAHRLTTLRNADRILVFQSGRVVEEGPYRELAERNGPFAELVRSAESES